MNTFKPKGSAVQTVKRAALVFTTLALMASGCAGDGAAPKSIGKSNYSVNPEKTSTKHSWRKTDEKNGAHILVQENLVTVISPTGRRFDFTVSTNLADSEVKSSIEDGKAVFSIKPTQNGTKTVRIASEKDTVYVLE